MRLEGSFSHFHTFFAPDRSGGSDGTKKPQITQQYIAERLAAHGIADNEFGFDINARYSPDELIRFEQQIAARIAVNRELTGQTPHDIPNDRRLRDKKDRGKKGFD